MALFDISSLSLSLSVPRTGSQLFQFSIVGHCVVLFRVVAGGIEGGFERRH